MMPVLETQNGAVDRLPRHYHAQVQCSSLLNGLQLISRLKDGHLALLFKTEEDHPLRALFSLVSPEDIPTWLREELEKAWETNF